jgi:hypothetical protein
LLLFPQSSREDHARKSVFLASNLNSIVFDYVARQKFSGGSLNKFILVQLPFARPDEIAGFLDQTDWIVRRVLELTYTAWDLEPFALDCGYEGPPFRWDEERRFLLRCELDAAYFHLYLGASSEWGVASGEEAASGERRVVSGEEKPLATGHSPLTEAFPTPRHAVDYIMDTFPIVRRKDEKAHGEYRTKRVILEMYDQMAEAIRTGQPYQTRINPPPGPPTDADGNFIPMAQWDKNNWPSHIHPPREVASHAFKDELPDGAIPLTIKTP